MQLLHLDSGKCSNLSANPRRLIASSSTSVVLVLDHLVLYTICGQRARGMPLQTIDFRCVAAGAEKPARFVVALPTASSLMDRFQMLQRRLAGNPGHTARPDGRDLNVSGLVGPARGRGPVWTK